MPARICIITYEMKHREGGGDVDDAAPPPTTVGGCLTRLVRENGVQTCPRRRGNGEE